MKRIVLKVPPLLVATLCVSIMCIIFLVCGLLWGNLGEVVHVPLHVNVVMIASGAYGLLVGMGLSLIIVRHMGIIVLTLIPLISPLLIGILEYLLLGQNMTSLQVTSGLIVLFGSILVTWSMGGQEQVKVKSNA